MERITQKMSEPKHVPMEELNNLIHDNVCRENSIKLQTIFPEEIWQIIIFKHSHSSCFANISNASPYFRNLLLQERAKFLFPSVWKVLGAEYLKHYETNDAYNEHTLCKVDKHGFFFIPYKFCEICRSGIYLKWYSGILKMRLACKLWCTTINFFFHSLDELSIGPIKRRIQFFSNFAYHFVNPEYSFNKSLTIFSKTVEFYHEIYHEPEYFFLDMLLKFGEYFQNCTILLQDRRNSRVEWYRNFKELLSLVPNVKSLDLKYHRVLHLGINPPDTRQEFDLLETEVQTNPLGSMEHLESLSVSGFHTDILYGMVRACRNIKSLKMKLCQYTNDREVDFGQLDVEQLEKFSFIIKSNQEFRSLETSQFNWQLKEAEIDIHENIETLLSWSEVFQVLKNKWGNTLTKLTLTTPFTQKPEDQEQIREWGKQPLLELPNLTNLKLVIRKLHVLDFILPLKDKLEFLSIEMGFNVNKEQSKNSEIFDEARRTQSIHFLGYTTSSEIMKSNIWEKFQNLKEFHYMEKYDCREEESWMVSREQLKQKT